LEVIKSLAAAATAAIAFFALRNWRRQDKAKREAEFLDSFLDTAHDYIAEIYRSIAAVKYMKLAMSAYVDPSEKGTDEERVVKGAILLIPKMGESGSKRISTELEAAKPSMVRLKSLTSKGQVFKFEGYERCLNSVTYLTWQYDRISALASLMGQTSINWNHPDALKTLKAVLQIDPDEAISKVAEHNVILIDFVRETYARLYSNDFPRKRGGNA